MFASLVLDTRLVSSLVSAIDGIGLSVGRIVFIRSVQEILHPHEYFLDRNSRSPLTRENAQTNPPRRIYVWMKDYWSKDHHRSLTWIIRSEINTNFVQSAFPIRALFARDTGFPFEQIRASISLGRRSSVETNWVIFPPFLSLLRVHNTFRSDGKSELISTNVRIMSKQWVIV